MRTLLPGLLAASLLLGAGCALRPRYGELLPPQAQEGQVVAYQLVDADTRAPLPDVPVALGEGQGRVRTRTDAQGVFAFPVSRAWERTNPVLEVTLPRGVHRFELLPAGAPQAGDAGAQRGPEPLRADPTGLLTGCQVEPTPTGVSVECPELMAVSATGKPGEDAFALAQQMVDEFARDFAGSFGGEVQRQELELQVAGASRRGLQFEAQLPEHAVKGTVVAVDPPAPGAPPRAVLCMFVGEQTRPCAPLLDLLATEAPAAGIYGP
jgi:hypothetical protein